ncbi:hypothetical protein CYMTET_28851 [Cymbomonas tetramitiformis]|uniref:Uncharacterized protein n=1 Tax=Cymbomonas tetramitiformis TaxID=36881 RepID=A0AAE0FM60_9CHLO|nr:hypothetical protein CYMTET_28851 [Cymbomonas tetramitiformis]
MCGTRAMQSLIINVLFKHVETSNNVVGQKKELPSLPTDIFRKLHEFTKVRFPSMSLPVSSAVTAKLAMMFWARGGSKAVLPRTMTNNATMTRDTGVKFKDCKVVTFIWGVTYNDDFLHPGETHFRFHLNNWAYATQDMINVKEAFKLDSPEDFSILLEELQNLGDGDHQEIWPTPLTPAKA